MPYYWNIAPNRDATFTLQDQRAPRAVARRRVPLPRADATAAQVERSSCCRTTASPIARAIRSRAEHDGELPYDAYAAAARAARLRRRLLEGLPGRGPEPDAAPAADRPAGLAAVRRLDDLRAGACAGRCCRPTIRRRGSSRRTSARRRSARATPGRGAAASTSASRPSSTASPTRTTASSTPRARPAFALHALGSIARPFVAPGWTVTPKVSFNAASYSLDSAARRRPAQRVARDPDRQPRQRLDARARHRAASAATCARRSSRACSTSTRRIGDQSALPNFDSAPKDFNFDSIFTENAFSGVDRVSDAHQLTAGVTTRVLDPETGAEALRARPRAALSAPRPARHARRRAADAALLRRAAVGSTSLVPRWTLDAALQYNPDSHRIERSLVGMRYSPGPFRTVSADLPADARPHASRSSSAGSGRSTAPGATAERSERAGGRPGCSGTLYSVGRLNYSTRDSRLTDSIVGVEYDAGCWIGRVVVERLSTGRSEATTRLLLQLELVGLSRTRFEPAQGLEGQYPRLPAAARRAHDDHTVHSRMTDLKLLCRRVVAARGSRPRCRAACSPRPATTSSPSSTRSWSPRARCSSGWRACATRRRATARPLPPLADAAQAGARRADRRARAGHQRARERRAASTTPRSTARSPTSRRRTR